jgi:DNA polymerase V
MRLAGFPSPADEYGEVHLSITELLAPRPAATYFVRVTQPIGKKIFPGDILIIDRSLKLREGAVVLAVLRGKFCVRVARAQAGNWRLFSLEGKPERELLQEDDELWGVVSYVIHKC